MVDGIPLSPSHVFFIISSNMACVGNPPFRLIIFSLESYDLDQTKWGITDMNGDYPHEW